MPALRRNDSMLVASDGHAFRSQRSKPSGISGNAWAERAAQLDPVGFSNPVSDLRRPASLPPTGAATAVVT